MAQDPDPSSPQQSPDSADHRLHRRDFLAYTSVGLLAPWLAPLAARAADETIELVAGPGPLSVGYITDSAVIPDLRQLNRFIRRPAMPVSETDQAKEIEYSVVPAHELPIGDPSLVGNPLRIRLHGLYPPRLVANRYWADLPERFALDLLYPNPDPALTEPLRHAAWTFERLSTAWINSNPVALAYPLDWNAMPTFELTVTSRGKTRRLATRFTVDTEEGQPRLRRGLYLLGLSPRAWDDGMSLHELGSRMPPSRFSFLVAFEQAPTGHL